MIKDENKTKERLINELVKKRQRITELETLEIDRTDQELFTIAKGVSEVFGEKFFISLVQHLAEILSVDYAYSAELIPDRPGHAKTLAFFVDGKIIENIVVNISGTPCAEVSQNGFCSCPAEVQKLYPSAKVMAGMNVESYAGVKLPDASGTTIGLLSVMNRKPMKNIDRVESMLQIFGVRAAAELDRLHTEEELKKHRNYLERLVEARTTELNKQKTALERKNIALREVIGQIEFEKNKIKGNILSNVDELIMPLLNEYKAKGSSDDKFIDVIMKHLEEITSSFGCKITDNYLQLSRREIEVCNLVEKGSTNKEIAKILSLSIQTVESYRQNIRKKLGLAKKKLNLATYLRNLSERK